MASSPFVEVNRNGKKQGKRKGKARGLRKDRDCLTCKRRQVKCDLNRPACDACKSAHLDCGGYTLRIRWISEKDTPICRQIQPPSASNPILTPNQASGEISTSNPCKELSPTSSTDIETDHNWTTNISAYLRYFTMKLDQAWASHEATSPFLSLAETSDLSDVWNFAWTHIGYEFRLGRNASVDNGLLHISALNALGRAVKAGHIFAIFGITTFAFLDVREGPFGGWERHLRGARALLDIHCNKDTQFKDICGRTPGLQQAISLLNWYDVMGLVIHQDRDLIFDDWHREYMDDAFFDLVGCPREKFQLYVNVASRHISKDVQNSYHLVLTQLLQLATNRMDEQTLLHDGWRLGAVLAAVSCLAPKINDTVGIIADRICDVVENVNRDHEAYVHLAVIVYLTGVYGTTTRHGVMVRRYWSFFNSRTVPEYPLAQELCDKARSQRRGLAC